MFLGLIGFGGGGCASQTSPPIAFHYKNILERQKAGMPLAEDHLKNLPDMTAAEHETLGDTHLQQGNMSLAFSQYEKALRLDPDQIRIRYKTGLLFLKKGLPEDALKEFQVILKKDMRYALAYEGIGQALFQLNNLSEAEKNLLLALQFDGQLWQSHNFLGIIYDRQNRFEDAVAEFNTALALNPEQWLLFNNLGMSYYHKGEYIKAIEAFLGALRMDSSQRKAYNNLGLALGRLGRYQSALEAFKKGGDDAKAYNNLGVVYMRAGRYQEAITSFEKAIELNPSYYLKASENLKLAKNGLSGATVVSATTGTLAKAQITEEAIRPRAAD